MNDLDNRILEEKKKEITDEEIFNLREQGLSYQSIADYFADKGMEISYTTVSLRCKKIYKSKGREEPKAKRKEKVKKIYHISDEELIRLIEQGLNAKKIKMYYEEEKGIQVDSIEISKRINLYYEQKRKEKRKNQIIITYEEIFNLRQQGLSYQKIVDYFKNKGIKVSYKTISESCKKIYDGKEEPKVKSKADIVEEEIFNLREQGLSYKEIEKHFESIGILIDYATIRTRCKKIYEEKGKKEPEIKAKKPRILDEELFKLSEQGLSFEEISIYFYKKGIMISASTIANRCKRIYAAKGKEDPHLHKPKITDEEELFNLREQGLTYQEIKDYYFEKGIKISRQGISQKCKEIYEKKGKKEPDRRKVRREQIKISDEEIYSLREQGLSYGKIAKYFTDKGIKVSSYNISERCTRIYTEKGKKEPKTIRKMPNRIDINDEEILDLREQGLSCKEIFEYFRDKGIKVSLSTIKNKCKIIYQKKGKKQPHDKRKKQIEISDEKIYNLREQGLTYKEIANYFNNNGVKVSYSTIALRCKKIYDEKGKKAPKAKTRENEIKVSNEEIYNLREQGLSYKEISEYYKSKGIKISISAIRK